MSPDAVNIKRLVDARMDEIERGYGQYGVRMTFDNAERIYASLAEEECVRAAARACEPILRAATAAMLTESPRVQVYGDGRLVPPDLSTPELQWVRESVDAVFRHWRAVLCELLGRDPTAGAPPDASRCH